MYQDWLALFPWKGTVGLVEGFGFGFLLVTWINSQKSVSGTELSAFSVDRQHPVVVLCCSAPHPAPSCLLSWFIHLLCPPCSHKPNTLCVHFFFPYIPHHVCLSYTVCKSVILVSQINAFLALVCLDKGVFLFNAPMNSLKHLQILISGVVQ